MPPETRKLVAESDLKELLSQLEDRIESKLDSKFDVVRDDIISLKETVIQRLLEENTKLRKIVSDLETEVQRSQQYGRRNNLELSGIPSSVENKDLEEKVISVVKCIGVDVTPNEIEACHRLPKTDKNGNKTTIIRFVNRKKCVDILQKRKKFKDLKLDDKSALGLPADSMIFANENLSPYNSHLAWKCRKLKRGKKVFSTWFSNGTVIIRIFEEAKPIKIFHENELDELFPDFDFEG